jgi:hypothetical protein
MEGGDTQAVSDVPGYGLPWLLSGYVRRDRMPRLAVPLSTAARVPVLDSIEEHGLRSRVCMLRGACVYVCLEGAVCVCVCV